MRRLTFLLSHIGNVWCAFSLWVLNNRQTVFTAELVRFGSHHRVVIVRRAMELLTILEANAIENKVVVQMLVISMACDKHFVLITP